MKKIILPVIASVIIFISNISLAETGKVNVTAVRIRESMSTDSNIITNIYEDDEVEILEKNGEWCKIKYNDKVGYAKTEFFKLSESASQNETTDSTQTNNEITDSNIVPNQPVPDETVQNNTVSEPVQNETTNNQELTVGESIILNNPIKVRIMPNMSSVEKYEIASNSNITILTELGNWYKITDQTKSGWILKTKLNTITSQPPAQENVAPSTSTEEPVQNVVPNTPTEEPVQNTVPESQTNEASQPETKTPEETNQAATTTKKRGIVIVETARIREKASTDADVIGTLDEDDIVTIEGEEGNFYKISTDKINGYVGKSLIKEKDITSRSNVDERITEKKDELVSEEQNNALNEALTAGTNSVNGDDIVNFAKQYLGYPYVLGASSPEKGFDCSGFTRYVYGHFGYKLGQVAANQTSLGAVVEKVNLQTGDLILFYDDGKTKIGHCGIYISGGDFIHSANPQRGVVIDNLNTNSYYNSRFVTARRIIN